jgi:flagellar L-ring protein precursor FlgH
MTSNRKHLAVVAAGILVGVVLAVPVAAQSDPNAKTSGATAEPAAKSAAAKPVTVKDPSPSKSNAAVAQAVVPNTSYEELYERYLKAARMTAAGPDANIRWVTGLYGDPRAYRTNDLLTVRVIESITASGTADASVNKKGDATAGVPNLFGLETKVPSAIDMSKLASVGSESKFTGGGSTNRAGTLTAVMTARVAEVLPNGDLVLEGAREIAINGDRQMVVLTGVVRPSDVLPNNTVLSTQIGQLSIRYFGNGLIKDSLKPGILVRLLNKVF